MNKIINVVKRVGGILNKHKLLRLLVNLIAYGLVALLVTMGVIVVIILIMDIIAVIR